MRKILHILFLFKRMFFLFLFLWNIEFNEQISNYKWNIQQIHNKMTIAHIPWRLGIAHNNQVHTNGRNLEKAIEFQWRIIISSLNR